MMLPRFFILGVLGLSDILTVLAAGRGRLVTRAGVLPRDCLVVVVVLEYVFVSGC